MSHDLSQMSSQFYAPELSPDGPSTMLSAKALSKSVLQKTRSPHRWPPKQHKDLADFKVKTIQTHVSTVTCVTHLKCLDDFIFEVKTIDSNTHQPNYQGQNTFINTSFKDLKRLHEISKKHQAAQSVRGSFSVMKVFSGDSCSIPPNYAPLMSLKTEWCGTLHCALPFAELPNVTPRKEHISRQTLDIS